MHLFPLSRGCLYERLWHRLLKEMPLFSERSLGGELPQRKYDDLIPGTYSHEASEYALKGEVRLGSHSPTVALPRHPCASQGLTKQCPPARLALNIPVLNHPMHTSPRLRDGTMLVVWSFHHESRACTAHYLPDT